MRNFEDSATNMDEQNPDVSDKIVSVQGSDRSELYHMRMDPEFARTMLARTAVLASMPV